MHGQKSHSKNQKVEKHSEKRNTKPVAPSLLEPHLTIIAHLEPKHHVLHVSVISSSSISKRVTTVTTHLLEKENTTGKTSVALLHARTSEASKLITVVEQCKRILTEAGVPWYQYNQLYDQPDRPKKQEVVEETVLEGPREDRDDSEDEDDFEVMESRFEKAMLPLPPAHVVKSMRVFLSTAPIPELKVAGATLQTSQT